MYRKILITGCSGFLGEHLVRILAKDNQFQLTGITEVDNYNSPDLDVYHLDIRDKETVFSVVKKIQPDLTFHLAAIANVGFSWKHQKDTYEINFIGSSNLFEAIEAFSPHSRILLMSSAELYGDCKNNACKESDCLDDPKNPYSLSKYAMEMVGKLYKNAKGMDVVTVRSFNFTGPGQSDQFVASDFSHQIAKIEKGLQEPVIRVGNLSAVRDISDVRDIARYLSIIAQQAVSGGVYNLCSGSIFSIEDILNKLISLSKTKIQIVVDKNKLRPVDIPILWGDTSLIKTQFNLTPAYDIKQTLQDLLNFWRNRLG